MSGSLKKERVTVVVLAIAYFVQTVQMVISFITRDALFIQTYGELLLLRTAKEWLIAVW